MEVICKEGMGFVKCGHLRTVGYFFIIPVLFVADVLYGRCPSINC